MKYYLNKAIDELKERWEVDTVGHIALIMFLFSITGMSTLLVRSYMFQLFDVNAQMALWLKIILWISIDIPTFQVLFLIYGFLLGQFDFVWRYEKKSIRRIKNLFSSS